MSSTAASAASPGRRAAPLYRGVPFFGALPELRRDMLGTFERIARLGDVVQIRLPLRVGFLVTHPDGVKHVLVDNHKSYGKKTRGYQMLRHALGQGLVTSEGEHWRRQRRIAQPAFHHQRIAGFAEIMTRATEALLESWAPAAKSGAPIELHDEMMRVTLRIVGECLLSRDLSDESGFIGPAITTVLEETVHRVQHPLMLPLSIPTPRNLRYRRALAGLDARVHTLIQERKANLAGAPKDLLTMFIEARDEETGAAMSDEHLRDEVMTMVSAGHETTANALTWAFYLLSENPAAAERLQAEVRDVLSGRSARLADLPQLRYTESVVKEAMRLLPPVWMIARSVEEADEICGVSIPQRAMVFMPQYVVHRDPRFWPRALEFRPERWLEPEIEALPKYAYFPFSGGPRVCIGNNFAMMEAQLILATIAGRYSPRLVPGHPVVPVPTVTLRPRHGLEMTLSPVRSVERSTPTSPSSRAAT